MESLVRLRRILVDACKLAFQWNGTARKVITTVFVILNSFLLLAPCPWTVSINWSQGSKAIVEITAFQFASILICSAIAIVCISVSLVKAPRFVFSNKLSTWRNGVAVNYGIEIKNSSWDKTIEDCRVELVSFEPNSGVRDGVHICLHCSGVIYPVETVKMDPRASKTFDVFTHDSTHGLRVAGYNKDLEPCVPAVPYRLILKASGKDVPPVELAVDFVPIVPPLVTYAQSEGFTVTYVDGVRASNPRG